MEVKQRSILYDFLNFFPRYNILASRNLTEYNYECCIIDFEYQLSMTKKQLLYWKERYDKEEDLYNTGIEEALRKRFQKNKYITKDDLADWKVQTEDPGLGHNSGLRGTTIEQNPYIWGSTVKRFRDDQFFRMTMEHYPYRDGLEDFGDYSADDPHYVDKPKHDVMDTDEVQAEGMNAYKNYPSEGWRSFGGKYDFLPYTGVLGRPRGNARV